MPARRYLIRAGWAAAALAGCVAGVIAFAWSGLYSVAASKGHFAAMSWLLELGMRSSVRTHSAGVAEPFAGRLADPDLVRLGAGHYHTVCVICHGAAGEPPAATVRHMLPPPPPLRDAVGAWRDRELFWLVKHGIKYTGMPSWPTQQRDDEVWAMVAFLRRLASLDAAEYRELAMGNARRVDSAAPARPRRQSDNAAATACARCHDDGEQPPVSNRVPRLSGQREAYLANALRAYAEGHRASGIMREVASRLDAADIERLARHYARLGAAAQASQSPPDPQAVERGRRIAMQGIAGQGVPPCLSCHGEAAAPTYPLLAGQSPVYLEMQLRLWRSGRRGEWKQARLMGEIARRLSETQLTDAVAYFAATRPQPAPDEVGQQ